MRKSSSGYKWRKNTSLGVWLICQNPNCTHTDNSNHVFLAKYRNRNRKYCSRSCHVSIKNMTLDARLAASKRLKLTWKTNQELRRKNTCRIIEYNNTHSEEIKVRGANLLKNLWNNSEFRERKKKLQSDFMKSQWENLEIRDCFINSSRKTMLLQIERGVFGYYQKLLFNELTKKDPQFRTEEVIKLSQVIRDKYECNNQYYRLDIVYKLDNQVLFAVEVDGQLGHHTDEEKSNDKRRDIILLNEFNIPTTRITNEEIKTDLSKVTAVVEEIKLTYTSRSKT